MVETSGSTLLDFVRSQLGTGVVGLSFSNEALKKGVMGEFGLAVSVHGEEKEALEKAKEVAKRLRERGFHAAVEVVGSEPSVLFFAPPGNPSSTGSWLKLFTRNAGTRLAAGRPLVGLRRTHSDYSRYLGSQAVGARRIHS